MDKNTLWKIITIVELVSAAAVVILDLFIPTIVILSLIVISLLIRRETIATLGFKSNKPTLRMAFTVFLLVLVWTLLHLSFFMPVLNHLTGTTQDLSDFADLQGNHSKLLFLLGLTWTLAAFGEEIVYRGYLQRRMCDLLGHTRSAIFWAVGFSSLLFGLAHTEQGIIGVVLTTLDAVFFSWLKYRYENNLWASILAHGLSNTTGLVAFYFVGPIYGFW